MSSRLSSFLSCTLIFEQTEAPAQMKDLLKSSRWSVLSIQRLPRATPKPIEQYQVLLHFWRPYLGKSLCIKTILLNSTFQQNPTKPKSHSSSLWVLEAGKPLSGQVPSSTPTFDSASTICKLTSFAKENENMKMLWCQEALGTHIFPCQLCFAIRLAPFD